ncbi:MAG: class I SAM-dependent methyltransferase [Paracoccaceae bacterium]
MTDTANLATYTAANRAAWDASAPIHAAGDGWATLRTKFAIPGYSVLDKTLTDTFNSLNPKGKRVVQIGCNNGRELLSMPAFGAIAALGIDQSAAFLAQATQLAQIANQICPFLCADIYDLPKDIPRNHDIALITIGVLNWMPDLPRFFATVASLLVPGGTLVIYETHPILEMFDPEGQTPFTPATSYFATTPVALQHAITYDGSDAGAAPTSYWFIHTLGQIITACAASGLTIARLTEHPHSNREVEYDKYEDQSAQLPLSYTLIARKP